MAQALGFSEEMTHEFLQVVSLFLKLINSRFQLLYRGRAIRSCYCRESM
jgi:hypothetical protein